MLSRVVVAQDFNLSSQEAESGGALSWGWPGLQSEFQDGQGYLVRLYLKITESVNKPTKQTASLMRVAFPFQALFQPISLLSEQA